MTLFAEAAHQTATSDRESTAAMVLAVAAEKASDLIRQGRFTEAAAELERAERSARLILGPGASS